MKRLAVLIGAPGWPGQPGYLPGVARDIANYERCLRSPTGGAWGPAEVLKPPLNPELASLRRFVGTLRAAHVLVVFSGHGHTDSHTGRQLVNVNPQQVAELRQLVPPARTGLVVVDACRVYQGAGLAGIIEEAYEPTASALSASVARRQYDQHLAACAPGWTTLFGCRVGRTSQDTQAGGNFSLTLLETINEWVRAPSLATWLPAPAALARTEQRLLHQRPFQQQPQLYLDPQVAQQPLLFPLALRQPGRGLRS